MSSKRIWHLALLFFLLGSSNPLLAEPKSSHYGLHFRFGFSHLAQYNDGEFPRGNLPPDLYLMNSNTTNSMTELGITRYISIPGKYFSHFQVGLSYNFSLSGQSINGQIEEFGLPQFKNYNYSYDINHHTLLSTLTADIYHGKTWSPFINLGIGAAFNSAQNFKASPEPGITPARQDLNFNSKNTSSFAYQIGLGLRYKRSKNLAFSISYKYLYAGEVKLGENSENVYGPTIKLYYNALMMGVSYHV